MRSGGGGGGVKDRRERCMAKERRGRDGENGVMDGVDLDWKLHINQK